jgi:hypothetical protein
MDERLEKAFQTVNLMTTLANQKRLALEEYTQSCIFYTNGCSFSVNRELISFVKNLIDLKVDTIVLLDDNSIPFEVKDLKLFLDDILAIYFESSNAYMTKIAEIKKKRKIQDLVDL